MIMPAYGSGSLADVLPSALAALGVPGERDVLDLRLDGVRRIAVLLIDGLGHGLLPLAAPSSPALAELARTGRRLTAGFPSTTPTSLVTLSTGAPPGSHGVLGFFLNIPGTDRVLNHIEWHGDPDPLAWQPLETRFARAAASGVTTTVVSLPQYAGSGLTRAAWRGAAYVGAPSNDGTVDEMIGALVAAPRTLVYGYHPWVDACGHVFGVGSPEWHDSVTEIDRLLARLVERLPPDAALLVTADHGQLDVPREHRFDMDTTPGMRDGVRVVAGEPRVRYLHTVPGARDDVIAVWRELLGDAAWVADRDEAVAAGWFGRVEPALAERIGDVVVACRDDYAVLASLSESPRISALRAYHGSFTEIEMAIPLLIATHG